MTDTRELAERIVQRLVVGPTANTSTYTFAVEGVEHILREHHEGLRTLAMRGVEEDGYDTAHALGSAMLRVLEGGEQAAASGVAADTDVTSPATPDPHEYDPQMEYISSGGEASAHTDVGCKQCDRPADDPIHDVPQVTNYDAEAEAEARRDSGNEVTVGPGDEVVWADVVLRVGYAEGEALVCHYPSQNVRFNLHNLEAALRTPDGRPVRGFEDVNADKALRFDLDRASIEANEALAVEVVQARARIAELERKLKHERARAETIAIQCDHANENAYQWIERAQRYQRERDEAREGADEQARAKRVRHWFFGIAAVVLPTVLAGLISGDHRYVVAGGLLQIAGMALWGIHDNVAERGDQ